MHPQYVQDDPTRPRSAFPGDHTIYALVDPRDNTVRYVGKSKRSLEQRLKEHLKMRSKNKKLNVWMTELLEAGMSPRIESLCTCDDHDWEWLEMANVAHCKRTGALYNKSLGGRYGR